MIALLITAFIGIALFEIPGLIQRKYLRELLAFLVFWFFAFIISLLQVLEIKLPNPTKGIEFLVKFVLSISG